MKSALVIDLMSTPNGYSLIENDKLINNPSITVAGQLNQTQSVGSKYNKQKTSSMIPKKFIAQQNFTIYPYIYEKQTQNHRYVIIPARSQWFNLNNVNEIEKKALPEWFKQRKVVSATVNPIKFEKNQELYKKYRNHIIQLGKIGYVSPLLARKGLAGDASSIIRIHNFLQKWCLINYVYQKDNQTKQQQVRRNSPMKQQNSLAPRKIKDGFDKDKTNLVKSYDKNDLDLLRKITKKFRPTCNSCQSICGVAWYEYNQKMQAKIFHTNQQSNVTTVKSGQIFEYHLRVCFACYSYKNFPVVLSSEDFTKKSILQNILQIDFDKKYKKKLQQFHRISDVVQKNKFGLFKSSQVLKISEKQLLDTLMQIPMQKLQDISSIQPQTQDEIQKATQLQEHVALGKQSSMHKQKVFGVSSEEDQDLKIFQTNMNGIELEQRKVYEQFIQSWLLKIYAKMEQLEEWDKSIQWKVLQNQTLKKYNISEKLKNNFKI